jgi:RPA family protein
MKSGKLIPALLTIIAIGMFSCSEKNAPSPGPGQSATEPDTTSTNITADTLTCAQAVEMRTSSEDVVVKGYVISAFTPSPSKQNAEIIQQTAWIADDPNAAQGEVEAYYCVITDTVQKGDLVVLTGKLEVYQNTTIEIKNGIMRLLQKGAGGNSGGSGNGGSTTTDYTDITIAKALEIGKALAANASSTEKYRVVGTVTAVKTDPANVPSKFTNINMTIKDATGTIDCFYTNYLDNKPFSSADQIPAVGTKVAVIGPLYNYQGTAAEVKNGYISEINPADNGGDNNGGNNGGDNGNNGGDNGGNGDNGDADSYEISCIFLGEKALPKGWLLVDNGNTKEASADNFYEDYTLKLNKIGMGLQSPEFKAVNKVTVSFQIDRLTPKSSPDKSDGIFTLCGYNSENWPVNMAQVKTSKKDTYTIELQGQDIVYVRLIMNSFPYYGDIQCNPGIRRVDISLGK